MTDSFEAEISAERAKGCGLTFAIFLAVAGCLLALFIGYPAYRLFFEKHVLLVSSSPHHNYRITAIRYGDVTAWDGDIFSGVTLKESMTRAEIEIGTSYNGETANDTAQLSIVWSSDDLALITTGGRHNQTYQYEFNARTKQFKQVKNDNH